MSNKYREPTAQDIEAVVEVSDDGEKWIAQRLVEIDDTDKEGRFIVIPLGWNIWDYGVPLLAYDTARIKI